MKKPVFGENFRLSFDKGFKGPSERTGIALRYQFIYVLNLGPLRFVDNRLLI